MRQSEPSLEKQRKIVNIAVKQVRRVQVIDRNHLGEIDHDDLHVVVDEEIELVEIAVNEPGLSKTDDQRKAPLVDFLRVVEMFDVVEQRRVDVFHDDGMAIVIDRLGHRKSLIVKHLHESVLLLRGQPRKVEPGRTVTLLAAALVVAISCDGAERTAAEALELEDRVVAVFVLHDEDVGFLAAADAAADAEDGAALAEGAEGEEVVCVVLHGEAVVALGFVVDEFLLEHAVEAAAGAAVGQAGDALDEDGGGNVVVAECHFEGGEDAEVFVLEELDSGDVEFDHYYYIFFLKCSVK